MTETPLDDAGDELAASTSDASLRRTEARSAAIEREIATDPSKFRIMTGDRPTGALHIGHYFGSLANRVRLQDAGVETIILIADYQVITDRDGTGPIRERALGMVADYLAIGIDPARSTIYAHSAVPALNQLLLPFLSLVTDAELRRNPTVKAELEATGDRPMRPLASSTRACSIPTGRSGSPPPRRPTGRRRSAMCADRRTVGGTAVQGAVGKPVHHVPLGADIFRFTPYPNPPQRVIDVYSMGRRSEVAHEALLKKASRRELFYIYDTLPGLLIQPKDHRQHRDLVANCAKRSKFFVTYPAKVDMADETRGQSEVGARFFEGAATGAVLVGQAPTIPAFAKEFNWPNAVVDIGSTESDLDAALQPFVSDPARFAALSKRNAVEAIKRFDWSYRWREMLGLVGMQLTAKHLEREKQLAALAAQAEAVP